MELNELKIYNPKLWKDGICRGAISYSQAGALTPGNVVTNIFAEGFIGGPKNPITVAFNPTGSIPIGPSNSYPKPWRSGSQFIQDGTYNTQIGPFAKLVGLSGSQFADTCKEGQEELQCKLGVFGRLGLASDGTVGFRMQNWHGQNEGPYGAAYFNSQNGTNWHTWEQWWDGASKATVFAKWEDYPGSPTVEVEVAFDVSDLGDPGYYPGANLGLAADASFDLLVAMISIAAIARWVF